MTAPVPTPFVQSIRRVSKAFQQLADAFVEAGLIDRAPAPPPVVPDRSAIRYHRIGTALAEMPGAVADVVRRRP